MSIETTIPATFYEGWSNYQRLQIEAIAPLTNEQLQLKAAPHLRPIGSLVGHIIAARAVWFHRVMQEGSDDLTRYYSWDEDGGSQLTTAQLIEGLTVTWQLMQDCLNRWTPADLEQPFHHRYYGEISRQFIIWHLIEHDLHHGGEVGLTLGIHGITAPDI